jgi:type VI secretion system secreted protein VgrG
MAAAPQLVMSLATPLGPDVLLLHRMSAREELGRLSEFEIDALSTKRDINFDAILGKPVTVTLELATGGERYFNGYVTRFSQTGMRGRYHAYHASVRPWLWFLTRTSTCRIYQKLTVPEILKKLFDEHAVAKVELELTASYRKWEYCVQYRETDFNFVSRLMEQEGIYYYFRHAKDKHTLVLTDSQSKHKAFPGHEKLPFIPLERMRPENEAITDWTFAHEVQAGAYALDDYDFTAPRVDRAAGRENPRPHDMATYELYDYPGEYEIAEEGKHYAQARLEEVQSQYALAEGITNIRGLCTGSVFKLENYPRPDQNREYLVVAATHELVNGEHESMEGGGSDYSSSFKAISTREAFRARRITPKPVVQGPQTAIVVGRSGDEIHTDLYGRIKVQFHWDRLGKADQDSSCWIRVSQNWAGKRWGVLFLPRVGQEVIVAFLEGDPDRPIVTGCVYNADSMPPYSLPGEMTKSTIKSDSSKGSAGFNEIRFEDKKGSEQLFLHAERNQDNRVKKDSLEWIGENRHLIVKKDQKEKVEGDKHLTVKGDQNEKVDGAVSLKAGMDLLQKVGMNFAVDAGQGIHLKAGVNVVIEAGTGLTLKVGGNFISFNPAGIFIKGTMVMINTGGAAGSGSGCSPAAPGEPTEADTAEPGAALAVAATQAPPPPKPAPGAVSPQAQALKEAAKTGVPFCEQCEAAKAAQPAPQA